MNAAGVISPARRELRDQHIGQERWPDSVLLLYLSDGLRLLKELRPDLFLGSGDTMATPTELSETTDTLDVDEKQRPTLVDYVCSRALGEDREDAQNVEESQRRLDSFYLRLYGLTPNTRSKKRG